MTLKTEVARGLKWQTINVLGRQLLVLIVFTTLARLLEPSDFGLVAQVAVYLTLVGLAAEQGVGTALLQRQNLDTKHLDSAFWFTVTCAAFLCLLTILLADPVARLLGETRLVALLRWSSLALVINALSSVQNALLLREMDFRRMAIRVFIANLAGGGLGIGMALAGCGVWALVGQQLAISIGGAIFLWRASTYRPSFNFSLGHLKDLLHVSSSVFAGGLLWFFSSRLDQLLIGRIFGAPALGLYVVAGKMPELAKAITRNTVQEVSLPALSRMQGNHAQLRQAIYRGMELNALVSFAIFSGIALVAPDLVFLVFGSNWTAASLPCALLALYALANVLQIFFYPALLASGGVGKYLLFNVWHVIGVLLSCAFGSRFGINNLILGLIANELITSILALIFLRRRIGLSPIKYCRPCLAPACGSVLMGSIVWMATDMLSEMPAMVRLACNMALGGSTYIGFALLFNRRGLLALIDIGKHALNSRHKSDSTAPSSLVAP